MAVGLGFKIDDKAARKLGIKIRAVRKQLLHDVAKYWHENIFPRAFTPGNQQRLNIEERTEFYRKIIKPKAGVGQGKYVSEVLTGRSKRSMLAFATISGTAGRVTVSMRPPRYFTNPFIGTFRGADGKTKRITDQPDKPAEVTRVSEKQKEELRAFAEKRFQQLINQA